MNANLAQETQADREYREQSLARSALQRQIWEQEERNNRIAGALILLLMLGAVVSALVGAYFEERKPVAQQERAMREHTERMDHMFR